MSFQNHWTIRSSYDFQAHQQCFQGRCCFSQTAQLWFEVLPDLLLVLTGAFVCFLFLFFLIYSDCIHPNESVTEPKPPFPIHVSWQDGAAPTCFPSSPLTMEINQVNKIPKKHKTKRSTKWQRYRFQSKYYSSSQGTLLLVILLPSLLLSGLLRLLCQKLPTVSSCQEAHHHLFAFLDGE